jgi:hypothetical protein
MTKTAEEAKKALSKAKAFLARMDLKFKEEKQQ